jgi:hypothetical protein
MCTLAHIRVELVNAVSMLSGVGGYMVVRTPQKITCPICNQPIDLQRDKYADEDGKVVHENCYIHRLMSSQNDPPDPHHTE